MAKASRSKDGPRGADGEVSSGGELGEARGDFIAVSEGLEAGERVAVTGLLKLSNGQPILINDEGAPEADLAPEVPRG